ncbi:MAG: hypothetical protein JWQ96_3410 [Segetibacter sp.]|nr:hypothetical protein [Segetibacter sp.]
MEVLIELLSLQCKRLQALPLKPEIAPVIMRGLTT